LSLTHSGKPDARALERPGAAPGGGALSGARLPQPAPEPPPIVRSQDRPYPGVLQLAIDARDTDRGIIHGRLRVPVAQPGPLTLLYPKWMPGYHSPQNPLELLAGIEVRAGETVIPWRRDPVEVYAFHVDSPPGAEALEIRFQFLSPTSSSQGDVVVTPEMMNLQWGRMLLYPAGYFSRGIEVEATLTLPEGWSIATALDVARTDGATTTFSPTPLDVLVDSPVMAGAHLREISLDQDGQVRMALFAHQPEPLQARADQIASHQALVRQADRLFASRHFDRYRFLVALSGELGGGGVEHHRCAEIVAPTDYFTAWERNFPKRDVLAHEYVHSWNGKFRRGADSWIPSFERPIRNSLMWVYEGQTQYWGHVLTARAGLWSTTSAIESLAKIAATYHVRPGGLWRTMADTTRDPIIASRAPLPWPSWQRSEDYYSEGQLMWLTVDTLIRELSGEARSLDDFAAAFFGVDDGSMITRTYVLEDVVRGLNAVAEYDWAAFLETQLENRDPGAPLSGVERGGYRLVYRDHRTDFCKAYDAVAGQFDLRFSIGLTVSDSGVIQEVLWGSSAFDAGLTAGSQVEKVNGADYSHQALGDAIEAGAGGEPIRLSVMTRGRSRAVEVAYREGHRFPHLEPIAGARRRLDEILAPR
jgi:predicted metalloprotease with PDZ domain